ERVGCPYCGSLLDLEAGNLRLLKSLKPGKYEPLIPLGTKGTLDGTTYEVIGYFVRSVRIEGEKFFWEEYLLYEPRAGFRWLVRSDDHWNDVRPLPPGEVSREGRTATYQGKSYTLYQRSAARMEYVVGECYWKVEVGETVEASDFIKPPEMLSQEVSLTGKSEEINWSLGTSLPPAAVRSTFGVADLPVPQGIAPNQPYPYRPVYRYWLYFLAAALVLATIIGMTSERQTAFEKTITF